MSGLIYELAWVRSLELIFGATTFAVATVLAAFMGGLAGGSYFIGRIGKKFGHLHPLRVYAVMEVIIAVLGILVPLSFAALVPVYQEVWKATHASFITFSALRFCLSALVLFIPTFMMGATLPIVSSYVNRQGKLGKGRIGLLYTCNTAGAVLGCLAAGLYLFPTIGLAKTQWVAIVLNLLAAAGGWRLSQKAAPECAPSDESAVDPSKAAVSPALQIAGPLIVAYAVSGFVAMVYEVAWSRVLVLVLGSTTYACTIMLATFLLGLTLGAFGAARLRLRQPLLSAGICQFAIAVTTWLSVMFVEEIPWLYTKACEIWHPVGSGLLLLQIAFSAGLMILPTLGLGAMFPITIQGLRTGHDQTARVVGWAYAWNTIGAIAGSVLAGFLFVPVLGSQKTLLLGVGLNLCLSFIAIGFLKSPTMPRWRLGFTLLLVLFGANVLFATPGWDPTVLSSGVFRYARQYFGLDRTAFKERARQIAGEVLQFKEGLTCTVTILRNPECVSLLVNGKADASIPSGLNPDSNLSALDALHDLPTQVLFGQVPLLLAPNRNEVLVVGLGSGVTVGSVLKHPVHEVECVELEDAVVRGSQFFDEGNSKPLADPRLKLIVNDARNHLLVTEKKYDIIISEPSNPWIPGAASLFTTEFFELSRKRLATDGVFCQWIQLYQLQQEHFKTILQTFTAVFPHVHLFRIKHDTILLGSQQPLDFQIPELEKRLTPNVLEDLARIRVHGVEDLLAWYWIGEAELSGQLGGKARNTDDNMLIEFAAPLQVLASHTAGNGPRLADLFETSTGMLPHLHLPSETDSAAFWARVADAALEIKAFNLATNYAAASWRLRPNPLAASVLAETHLLQGRNGLAAEILGTSGFPNDPEILRTSAWLYSLEGRWKEAATAAGQLVAQRPEDAIGLFYLGRSLFYLGDHKASSEALRKLPATSTQSERLRGLPFYLGALCVEEKQYAEASHHYLQFLKYEPAHIEARTLLADALYHNGLVSEAAEQWQLIARLNASQASRLVEQAMEDSKSGRDTEATRALAKAARLDSANSNIILMLARQKQNQQDSAGAITLLKQYLELHPNRPDAVGYLSQFLADENKKDEARLQSARYRALTGHPWVEVR